MKSGKLLTKVVHKVMDSKFGLFLKQNDSTIMCYGGIALTGAAVALGVRAGYKLANKSKEVDEDIAAKKIDEKQARNTLIKEGVKVVAPVVITYAVGSFLGVKSHAMEKHRRIDVASKLAATTAAFAAYRKRVKEDKGEDKDFEYATGAKIVKDKKTGEKHVEGTVDIKNQEAFCFFWDSFSRRFCKNFPELNIEELRSLEVMWKAQLKKNRHVWLNDALRDLDMEEVDYGYEYGWFTEGPDDIPENMIEILGPADDQCFLIHFTCRPTPIKEHVFRKKQSEPIEHKFY